MSMTTTTSISAHDLVQAGVAALAAGDSFTARTRFRAATEREPDCAEAWFGLSTMTPALRDRRTQLQRVLELAPDHEEARRHLAEVEALLARGVHVQKTTNGQAASAVPAAAPAPAAQDELSTVCYRHQERATGLRCGSCERPICAACASNAPVGHLCPDCRVKRRPVNYQVALSHLAVAGAVGAIGGLLAATLLSFVVVGFLGFYIAMAMAPFVGAGLVMLLDRLTRAKRGRPMQIATGAAIVVGMLPVVLFGRVLLLLAQTGFAIEMLTPMLQEEGLSLWTLALSSVDPAMVLFMGLSAISAMYRLH
jgi:hypothetical protein